MTSLATSSAMPANLASTGNANPHAFCSCVGCGREGREFKDSKLTILPCFHIVCSVQCVKRMEALVCRKCNLQFEPNNVTECNLKIGELLQTYGTVDYTIYCKLCITGNAAINVCKQCKEIMCRNCAEMHLHMRRYSKHDILILEDSPFPLPTLAELRDQNKKRCQIHRGLEVKTFCDTCCQDLCDSCEVPGTTHAGHKLQTISSIDQESEKLLEAVFRDAKRKLELGKQARKDLGNKCLAVAITERKRMLNESVRQLELIKSALNRREEQLRKSLSEITSSKCEELNSKTMLMKDCHARLMGQNYNLTNPNNYSNLTELDWHFEMDKDACNAIIKEIEGLGRITYSRIPTIIHSPAPESSEPPTDETRSKTDTLSAHKVDINNSIFRQEPEFPERGSNLDQTISVVVPIPTQTTRTGQETLVESQQNARNNENYQFNLNNKNCSPQGTIQLSDQASDLDETEKMHMNKKYETGFQQSIPLTQQDEIMTENFEAQDDNEDFSMPALSPYGSDQSSSNLTTQNFGNFSNNQTSEASVTEKKRVYHTRRKSSKSCKLICKTCGMRFTRKDSMQTHEKSIHLGIRPHVCNEDITEDDVVRRCSKSFVKPSYLKRHVDSAHRKIRHMTTS